MRKIILFVAVMMVGSFAWGQDGALDLSFNPGIGLSSNNVIYSSVIQNDGKIVYCGNINYNDSSNRSGITRVDTNGTFDVTFVAGNCIDSSKTIYVVAIQQDGKIIIGGDFTAYNGFNCNYLARLNLDGSLDTSFKSLIGIFNNGYVKSIVVQPDGKIIIGGRFMYYDGISRNGITRLNNDGTLDLNFNPHLGIYGGVNSIVLQVDGKVVVGGLIVQYDTTNVNNIVRILSNGVIDTTFHSGTGFNDVVMTLKLQPDGKVLVGGVFTTYNGFNGNGIIRINSNGSIDPTFYSGTGPKQGNNDPGYIASISLQPDGKIIVGGQFSFFDGLAINGVNRLNSNGDNDITFYTGSGSGGVYGYVYSTAIQNNGKIIVAGWFSGVSGIIRNHIARLQNNLVGINEIPTSPITLSPNPTTSSITIKGITEPTIAVYNLMGQKVVATQVSNEVSLAQLPAGMYLVQVFNKDMELVKSEKVILNR